MLDVGSAHALGEIPLRVARYRELGSHKWRERFGPLAHFQRLVTNLNRAVGFEVANIGPRRCLNVINSPYAVESNDRVNC